MGKPSHFTQSKPSHLSAQEQMRKQRQSHPAIQPKMAIAPQKPKQPVAPPVYRPQLVPKVLQRKAAVEQQRPTGLVKPVAPPVYRPQPVPGFVQTKQAARQPPAPSNARARLTPTPSAPLARPGSVQPKAATGPSSPAERHIPSLAARAASGAVQAKSHAHPHAVLQKGPGHPAQPSRPPRGSAGIVQPYMADGWGNNCQGDARDSRDTFRQRLTQEEYEGNGANHVTGAVLEYEDRKGVQVKKLSAMVSGNPKNRRGESLYERKTKLTNERANSECSEPKILSQAADLLSGISRGVNAPRPTLYLATEWTPCARCETRIDEWRQQHQDVEIHISSGVRYTALPNASTWVYPINLQLTLAPINPLILSGYVPAPVLAKQSKATINPYALNSYALLMDEEEEVKKKPRPSPTRPDNQREVTQRPKQQQKQQKQQKQPATAKPKQSPKATVVVDNWIKDYVWSALGVALTVGVAVAADWLMQTGYILAANSGE